MVRNDELNAVVCHAQPDMLIGGSDHDSLHVIVAASQIERVVCVHSSNAAELQFLRDRVIAESKRHKRAVDFGAHGCQETHSLGNLGVQLHFSSDSL